MFKKIHEKMTKAIKEEIVRRGCIYKNFRNSSFYYSNRENPKCPICEENLVGYLDTIEGTITEHIEICPNGHYDYEYLYGHTNYGNGVCQTSEELEISRYIERMKGNSFYNFLWTFYILLNIKLEFLFYINSLTYRIKSSIVILIAKFCHRDEECDKEEVPF